MIKYHGTPIGGKTTDAAELLRGRHGLVSIAHPEQLNVVMENCNLLFLIMALLVSGRNLEAR